ncbi:protein arginine kinase [Clostridium sediminicola]|uniref:protein arginine kinase n=1 Tax=Clostridium sediminicola TaxID=3114879 RepID=UPI0031F1D98A
MQNWINTETNKEDVVLSSRIRLARNLKGIPFPNKLNTEKGKDIVAKVEEAFYSNTHCEENYKTYYLWHNTDTINEAFLEKHIISKKLLNNKNKASFIVDKDEVISIMINEEDHIRLQSVVSGFNINQAYEYTNKVDDLLEEKLDYAYDEKLGYLTTCPTNLGTGMRASVMLHLPSLTITKEINGILNALTQVGMTIRGLYGEGSRAYGNLYQISNQITLGISENEILAKLTAVINQVVNQEKVSREQILKKNEYELKDKIFRSLGLLQSAVLLNEDECLNLLSSVRMGVELGIINNISKTTLNKLMINSQSSIIRLNNQKVDDKQLRLLRAELIKEGLK